MSESSPGENFLIKTGVVKKRSQQRRKVLRCLGCIWTHLEQENQSPYARSTDIERCSGISNQSASQMLGNFRDAGILLTEKDVDNKHLRYMPADTIAGQLFRIALGDEVSCETFELPEKRSSLHPPVQTAAEFIATLRTRRKEIGVRREALATAMGVSPATIARNESSESMQLASFLRQANMLGLEVVLRPINSEVQQVVTESL